MRRVFMLLALAGIALGTIFTFAATAQAAVYTWGFSGTSWTSSADWLNLAVPGSGDIALFNATSSSSPPILQASESVGALWDTGIGMNFGGNGYYTLTLAGTTVNGNANTGIELDSGVTGTFTESESISLGAAQQWINNSTAQLSVQGANFATNGNLLTIAGSGSGTTLISGSISGGGGLTMSGPGRLTLQSANTYSGGTTISAGTIYLQYSGNLGSGTVGIAAGAQLLFGNPNTTLANNITISGTTAYGAISAGLFSTGAVTTLSGSITLNATANFSDWWNDELMTLSGPITGPGGLVFVQDNGSSSGGRFLISGSANNYQGSTTVNGQSSYHGMLYLGANNALPTSTALTLNNADLYLNGNAQQLSAINGSGTFTVQNGSTTAATLTLAPGTASTFSGVIEDNGLSLATRTSVTGQVALIMSGTGPLTLTSNNTYSGGTTISGGTLTLSRASTNNIGSTSAISINGGATLNVSGLTSGAIVLAQPLNAFGTGIATVQGSVNAGSQTINLQDGTNLGTLAITSGLTLNAATLTFDLGNSGADNDQIAVGGTATLSGTNTINVNALSGLSSLLTGAHAYTLLTAGGGLNNANFALSSSSLTVGGTPYSLSLSGNATGEYLNVTAPVTGLALAWTGLSGSSGSATWDTSSSNWSGPSGGTTYSDGKALSFTDTGSNTNITIAATVQPASLTFTNSSTAYTFSGAAIAGSASVALNGGGLVTFSSSNGYTGGTSLSAGTLNFGNVAALGSGTATFTGNATLQAGVPGTLANNLAINSGATGTLDTQTNAVTLSGIITGGGTLGKVGNGVLTLSSSNGYTGGTSLSAGTLNFGNVAALGAGVAAFTGNATLQAGVPGTLANNLAINSGCSGTFDTQTNAVTLSGVISGGGTLSKVGNGTLTLAGSNTYTGGTTISAGTLSLACASTNNIPGTSAISINGGATLNVSGLTGSTLVLAQPLNNFSTGSATVQGSVSAGSQTINLQDGTNLGTLPITSGLTLNAATLKFDLGNSGADNDQIAVAGAATLSGITTINVNALTGLSSLLTGAQAYTLLTAGSGLSNANFALSSSTMSVAGTGYLLSLSGNATDEYLNVTIPGPTLTWTGLNGSSGTATWDTSSINWSGPSGATAYADGSPLSFTNSGSNTNITIAATVQPASLTFTNSSTAYTFSGAAIAGSASVTLGGSGLVTLSSSNSYTGGTSLSAGTLNFGNVAALGSGTATFSGNATLQAGVPGTLANNLAINSGCTGTFDTQTNAVTLSGVITGGGTLSKVGNGSLTLTGSNAYTGGTTISAGTLQVGNGGIGASIGGTSSVVDNASLVFNHSDNVTFSAAISGNNGKLYQTGSGILTLTADNTYGGSTTIGSGGTLQIGGGGVLGNGVYTADISNSGALVFSNNVNTTQTLYSAISGPGAVVQDSSGGGYLNLGSSNGYTGGTSVNSGVLQISNAAALGSGTAGVAAGGQILIGSSNNSNATIANSITLSGTTAGGAIANGQFGGGNVTTLSGTIALNANANFGNWYSNNYLALSGLITGPGGPIFGPSSSLGSTPGGKFLVSGAANNYQGSTTVNGVSSGENGNPGDTLLYLGANNALPATTTLTLNYADLYLNGYSQQLPSINGSGTFSVQNGSTTAGTLALGAGDTSSTFSGVIKDNGWSITNTIGTSGPLVTGQVVLIKMGTGTLTLSNSNNYSGGTTLQGGALSYGNVSALGTGAVTFAGNATLQAGTSSGTLANAVVLSPTVSGTFDTQGYAPTLSGIISGSGALTKIGSGSLTLYGNNTYSGETYVGAGTLTAGVASAANVSGAFGLNSALVLANSAGVWLNLNNYNTQIGSLAGGGGNGGNVKLGTATLTIGGDNTSPNPYAGVISGSGGLTKIGSGTLSLSGSDTYSGATTVSGGTLLAGEAGAFSPYSAFNVSSGVLDVTSGMQTVSSLSIGSGGALNINDQYPLTVSNTATFSGGTLNVSSTNSTPVTPDLLMTYSTSAGVGFGSVSFNGSALPGTDSLSYSGGSLEIIGPSTWRWNSSAGGSWQNNLGYWTPSGVPSNGTATFPELGATSTIQVTLDGPQTATGLVFSASEGYTLAPGSGGTLTLSNSATVAVLSGTHTISAPLQIAGGSLVVAESGNGVLSITGNISDDNSQRSLTLTGDGSGQLVLSGTNSYGGGTNVNAGTMYVTNSSALPPATNLAVAAGGTFVFDPNGPEANVATSASHPTSPVEAVPEPGTVSLLAAGMVMGFGVWQRRKRMRRDFA